MWETDIRMIRYNLHAIFIGHSNFGDIVKLEDKVNGMNVVQIDPG